MVRFHHAQGIAVGTASIVEPGSVVKSERLRNECVVIHPRADGVSPPSLFWRRAIFRLPAWLFGILDQFPPVGPDDAPFLVELIQDHNLVWKLDDLLGASVVKNDARETLRIAAGHRIIRQRGGNLRDSISRLMGYEGFPPLRCIRQLVFRLSIRRHRLRSIGLDSFGPAPGEFPNPGKAAPRSGT